MARIFRKLVILGLLAFAAVGPFWLYFTQELSFYTLHALGGLMALKHLIAQTFLQGEYPLWNSSILCGVPFHSGIGILDPFLVSYLFLKPGIPALIGSAYLALLTAGCGMSLYLRRIWNLSCPASLLGGILYLENPFFAATSHEQTFMAPPVYLPLVFLFYEEGVRNRSWYRVLLSGLFLSLSFLSGNLESFYFVLLTFGTLQGARILFIRFETRSWKAFQRESPFFLVATLSPFLFSAIDFIPTFYMIFDSGREAGGNIVQNFIFFLLIAGISVLTISAGSRIFRKQPRLAAWLPWILSGMIVILFSVQIQKSPVHFHLDFNILYPNPSRILLQGEEAFQILMENAALPREWFLAFMEPRYIFYIQPPIYLFTLTTLLLFAAAVGFSSNTLLKLWGWIAVLLALFPFTMVPNFIHYFLRLDQIAYPRLMFGFFFIQALAVAYAFAHWEKEGKGLFLKHQNLAEFALLISGIGILGHLFVLLKAWDPSVFKQHLEQFYAASKSGGNPLLLSWSHLKLSLLGLSTLFKQDPFLCLFGISKYLSLIFLVIGARSRHAWWKYLLILSLSLEAVGAWNYYTFQKADIRYITDPSPEALFLKKLPRGGRLATLEDPAIHLRNFYEAPRPLEIRWNMPAFWGYKTIEGATLNLSPKLFRAFWALEPSNSFTPTALIKPSSPVYDLMGLNYLLTKTILKEAGYEPVFHGPHYHIYKNSKALPRYYFAQNLLQADAEILQRLSSGAWDPQKLTLVEDEPLPEQKTGDEGGPPEESRIEILRGKNNECLLQTFSPREEFLATTDAFHRFWRVFVDGNLSPVVKTNFYFRGVFTPPGTHQVLFKYEPLFFRWGIFITALMPLGLFLLFILERRHARRI